MPRLARLDAPGVLHHVKVFWQARKQGEGSVSFICKGRSGIRQSARVGRWRFDSEFRGLGSGQEDED